MHFKVAIIIIYPRNMCAHNDLYAEEVDDDWRKALRLI